MRAWLDAGSPSPVLHVLPAGTPDGDLPGGTVLDKRHSRFVLTFAPAEKGTHVDDTDTSEFTLDISLVDAGPTAGGYATATDDGCGSGNACTTNGRMW